MATKTHYAHGPHGNACKRASAKGTTNVYRVDCLACQKSDQFTAAKVEADAKRHETFMAQEPREFGEPWKDGIITCMMGHTLFRYAGRSCYGHYDEYVCAECGDAQSRLTEAGMSF
jgi:hypothetical protein